MPRFAICLGLAACTAAEEAAPTLVADPTDPASFAAAADEARYTTDLEALAVPRETGSKGWQKAQDLCVEVFTAAGFTVDLDEYGRGTNVIGRKAGTATDAGTVVLSAHYDSVPDCKGADDNASGVSGVLEAARLLGEGTWRHDLVVACWDEEERGLVGSTAWADAAKARGEDILLAWSLEMIGYASSARDSQTLPAGFELLFPDVAATLEANAWRGDFITFVGDAKTRSANRAFGKHAGELPVIDILLTAEQATSPLLGDLQRSDHASFWNAGYPAVMVTDTSEFRYGGYHCRDGQDAVARLDTAFATSTVRAVVGATAELLGGTAN